MVYLASQLIVKAWRTTGIVSADIGNQPTSRQMVDGLDLLNELLSEINIDGELLPYTIETTFPAVIGQESYLVPNLIQWQAVTFNNQTIRYSMQNVGRSDYFGTDRPDNITSLMYQFHVERTIGGSKLYLYFVPSQAFPINIVGLFGFASVTDATDMSLVYDTYYLKYLRLKLGEAMCNYYTLAFPQGSMKALAMIDGKIKNLNVPDLTVKSLNALGDDSYINYAQANIGRGWAPS